jgi:hypothetical protein
MPREVRRFFYNEAAHAMMKALELGRQRMQIRQVLRRAAGPGQTIRLHTCMHAGTSTQSVAQAGQNMTSSACPWQKLTVCLCECTAETSCRCRIPELDVETDVYRIGTLLEMVRHRIHASASKVFRCV